MPHPIILGVNTLQVTICSLIVSPGGGVQCGMVRLRAPLRKHHNTAIAFYGGTFSTQATQELA